MGLHIFFRNPTHQVCGMTHMECIQRLISAQEKREKEYPFIIKGSTAALKNDEAQNEITVRFLNLTNPGILTG